MKVYYQLFVYDKNEKLKRKTRRTQSKSFLKPLLYKMCYMVGGSAISTYDITNTARTAFGDTHFDVSHPGRDSYSDDYTTVNEAGIQVGTGTAAVAITDYAMNTKIVHGTGAGQFVHYGCWVLNPVTGASSFAFDIERIFQNSSGGSITVNETGLYDHDRKQSPYPSYCLIRDKLVAGVAVANGEYLKVKYTITVSV